MVLPQTTCLCVILPQLLLIALTFKPRKFLNSLTCEVYHPSFWWFYLYNLCRETKLQSFYCLKGRPYGFGLDKKNPQYIDFLHNINSTNNGCIFFIYLTARSITTWNIDGTYNPRQKNNKLYALVKNQISWDGNTGEPVYFEGFTLRREEPSKPQTNIFCRLRKICMQLWRSFMETCIGKLIFLLFSFNKGKTDIGAVSGYQKQRSIMKIDITYQEFPKCIPKFVHRLSNDGCRKSVCVFPSWATG